MRMLMMMKYELTSHGLTKQSKVVFSLLLSNSKKTAKGAGKKMDVGVVQGVGCKRGYFSEAARSNSKVGEK